MINLADVQEKIRMEKREEILKKHRWAISLGSDGRWMTYLPDPEHGRNRSGLCDKRRGAAYKQLPDQSHIIILPE